MKKGNPKNPIEAFLQAIRENPDDDTHRLVFADFLDENGDPVRAEFIRVQCELTQIGADDAKRPALEEREKALLTLHQCAWTDLAFTDWLKHRKRDCRNPKGHDFCKLVAQGVRARIERDSLPEDHPRRRKLEDKLEDLGCTMEDDYDYQPATCEMPLFDAVEFRRGFLEKVTIQDFAVVLFAEILPELGMIRDLDVENDSTADGYGDWALRRLVPLLERLPLRSLDLHGPIDSLETVRLFAASPGLRSLEKLDCWFEENVDPGEAVRLLADSPFLTRLRSLELEHRRAFPDAAVRAVLDSKSLVGLTRCVLRHEEKTRRLSASILKRFRERFGKDPDDWR